MDFIFGDAAAWFGECTIASNGGGRLRLRVGLRMMGRLGMLLIVARYVLWIVLVSGRKC